jgi:alkylation response protein AidB-like acyl-CoA dehydrogenase
MDFAPSSDQDAVLQAIDALARPFAAAPVGVHGFALTSPELDAALFEGGFLDVALEPQLGAETAAAVVDRIARLPYAVEAAASTLVRPLVGPEMPRPFCLVEPAQIGRPVRFLAPGATVVVVAEDGVSVCTAQDVEPADSLFAYPMARLRGAPPAATALACAPEAVRARWRVALAAELSGVLGAALESTVAYVSERKQFGRPLAAFQAVRHRLAEARVKATGLHWLALKAAATGEPGDAALAAAYAQAAASQTAYDLHQFLGAMGMTLEHPLHLWTYRMKALVSELGGRTAQAAAAADALWGPASV